MSNVLVNTNGIVGKKELSGKVCCGYQGKNICGHFMA